MIALEDGMARPAVHEKDQRTGALKGPRIFWPAVPRHDREDSRSLFQKFHQERSAGEELVLARPVTLLACYQHDFGQRGIRRLHLQGDAPLIVRVIVARSG